MTTMSLISCESFNTLLVEFMEDLAETFSDIPNIDKSKDAVSTLISLQPSTDVPMKAFYESLKDHPEKIIQKDPSLFEELTKIPFTGDIDLNKLYNESPEETQEAIWKYVQQLFATATTVLTMSPSMLSSIEEVANTCVDLINSGEMTEEAAKDPMFILQQFQKNSEKEAGEGGEVAVVEPGD